jgi:hypothetical protein
MPADTYPSGSGNIFADFGLMQKKPMLGVCRINRIVQIVEWKVLSLPDAAELMGTRPVQGFCFDA